MELIVWIKKKERGEGTHTKMGGRWILHESEMFGVGTAAKRRRRNPMATLIHFCHENEKRRWPDRRQDTDGRAGSDERDRRVIVGEREKWYKISAEGNEKFYWVADREKKDEPNDDDGQKNVVSCVRTLPTAIRQRQQGTNKYRIVEEETHPLSPMWQKWD